MTGFLVSTKCYQKSSKVPQNMVQLIPGICPVESAVFVMWLCWCWVPVIEKKLDWQNWSSRVSPYQDKPSWPRSFCSSDELARLENRNGSPCVNGNESLWSSPVVLDSGCLQHGLQISFLSFPSICHLLGSLAPGHRHCFGSNKDMK